MVARRSTSQEAAAKRKTALEAQRTQVERAVLALEKCPPAPRHLGKAGKEAWKVVLGERFRTISPGEVPLFVRYCEIIDRRALLQGETQRNGWSVPGSRPGMLVSAPWAIALEAAERELRQMERVLGIGPSHRANQSILILTAEEKLRRLNAFEPHAKFKPAVSSRVVGPDPRLRALESGER
jgi:P27 family predicted phage terminase small subunit